MPTRTILVGETPDAAHIPPGCRFHPRCPLAFDRCKVEEPPLFDVGDGHQAACWLAEAGPLDLPVIDAVQATGGSEAAAAEVGVAIEGTRLGSGGRDRRQAASASVHASSRATSSRTAQRGQSRASSSGSNGEAVSQSGQSTSSMAWASGLDVAAVMTIGVAITAASSAGPVPPRLSRPARESRRRPENRPMTTPAIETRGLRKAYGRTVALESLDIRVEAGEVFGFLGPNGAGKTTAVKLLLGLTRPTAGSGTVLGRAARRPRHAARASATCRSCSATRRGSPPARCSSSTRASPACERSRRTAEIERVLALVGLADRAGDRTGGFSKGMQQRLGLAAALLGDPALVILDEPTSALDPVGRDDVRAIIREAQARGSAVLLNSHLLGEVERLCNRVAIVHQGPGRRGRAR